MEYTSGNQHLFRGRTLSFDPDYVGALMGGLAALEAAAEEVAQRRVSEPWEELPDEDEPEVYVRPTLRPVLNEWDEMWPDYPDEWVPVESVRAYVRDATDLRNERIRATRSLLGMRCRSDRERPFEEVCLDYFAARMAVDECGCWFWIQATDKYAGMSVIHPGGRYDGGAYRWAYEHFIAPVPAGLDLDHTCGRGMDGCVNPWHVEPVTRAENNRRTRQRQRAALNSEAVA